jgi:hypothetical protein
MQTEAIVLITLYVLGCVAVVYTHRRYTRIARSIDAMLIVHSVTRPVGIHPPNHGCRRTQCRTRQYLHPT